jgi:hypothetical protein
MVAALVQGRRIEIRDLDQLSELVEASRKARRPLVLVGEREERYEVAPADQVGLGIPSLEQVRQAMAAAGSWKGNVDTERLKQEIAESRGQRARDWEPCDS